MRFALAIALGLSATVSYADLPWSPTIRTALVLSSKSRQPILVRVLSPFGSPVFPAAASSSDLEEAMRHFTLVRASSYDELRTILPALPAAGGPGLVMLDSNGRLLKRHGGFVHDVDIFYIVSRTQWRISHEDKIRALAQKNPSNPNLNGDLATLAAMDGDLGRAGNLFTQYSKKMDVSHRVAALEAMGDEWRMRGDFLNAIHAYRGALTNPMPSDAAGRLRVHLTLCLLRNGDPNGASAEISKVKGYLASSPLASYVGVIRKRIFQTTLAPRMGRPAAR
ncbi:hypothetical protein [Fimbriimonas ginsengisoli]|uniref:Tetratricopeptide repeat protein n=1 Tax=Fimbriimonas ginsengisoli Gsoil 348 TaxID=661478 RepID=A0A068NY12_FIMGI|nr:hypothetical protein [Fimbriimonas ginsengisoli]AIE86544.1 hypothetical protein OP10G_3176 [Fimbriimonas ginsengisoli Gsoil 348]